MIESDEELYEASVDAIIEWISQNSSDFLKEPKERKRKKKKNLWETTWGEWILDPAVNDPSSFEGKQFRLKFRVPFPLFEHIVSLCNDCNLFNVRFPLMVRVDTEFKVLIALRILGRGNCIDDICEMSGVANSTVNAVFKGFCQLFRDRFFSTYVSPPTGEYLEKVLGSYREMGMPGAFGSIDCTHVKWDMCPVSLTNLCSGKEGFPTLSFEISVDSSRLIHHCNRALFGTTQDMTVVRNDPYAQRVLHGLYGNKYFILYNAKGERYKVYGLYFISDNGYPNDIHFVCPLHVRMSREYVLWSEWIESVRKDVECTFGIMKARWRYLRHGVVYHVVDDLEAAFQTACILHNMLLQFDGLSLHDWESEVDWEIMDPDADVDYDEEEIEQRIKRHLVDFDAVEAELAAQCEEDGAVPLDSSVVPLVLQGDTSSSFQL
jgi:hypothetical protein